MSVLMQIGDLLDVDAIIPQVNAPSKRQALALVADVASRRFGLKAPEVLEALLEREQLGSTGVGHGVGVPHARLNGLERMRGVFVRLETPIDFKAVDEQPVDLLFALFAPADAGAEHPERRCAARPRRRALHCDSRLHREFRVVLSAAAPDERAGRGGAR
ncbi:MAG: PTS sugar transporter subunit IIA, partial [Caulobacteraceae bacterium]|nr:PTS sugar transporter subunit IIA [Caulobacteraceae bacterium]